MYQYHIMISKFMYVMYNEDKSAPYFVWSCSILSYNWDPPITRRQCAPLCCSGSYNRKHEFFVVVQTSNYLIVILCLQWKMHLNFKSWIAIISLLLFFLLWILIEKCANRAYRCIITTNMQKAMNKKSHQLLSVGCVWRASSSR